MLTYSVVLDERPSLLGPPTTFRFIGYSRDALERMQRDIEAIGQIETRQQVTLVRNAVLTPLGIKDQNRFTGAVFDEDRRSRPEAQVRRHGEGVVFGLEDEPYPADEAGFHLDQAWYGGVLFNGYGHVVLESIARLTEEVCASADPIVMHGNTSKLDSLPLFESILSRLGVDPSRLRLVDKVTRVGELRIPEAGFVVGQAHHLSFVRMLHGRLCAEAASAVEVSNRPVLLSRSALRSQRRRAFGELRFEAGLQGSCRIVHPEALTFDEQVAVVNSSDGYIGSIGSQMHNLLFRTRTEAAEVLYLTAQRVAPAYFQVDLLAGGGRTYVNAAQHGRVFDFGGATPFLLRPDLVDAGLKISGLAARTSEVAEAQETFQEADYYRTWTERLVEAKFVKQARHWPPHEAEARLEAVIATFQPRLANVLCDPDIGPVIREAAAAALQGPRSQAPAPWRRRLLEEVFGVTAAIE